MDADLRHLRWQCRRGMLELDHLLLDFLTLHYVDLSALQQQCFRQLLAVSDPELAHWLLHEPQAAPEPFAEIIQMIRAPLEPVTAPIQPL